MHAVVTRWNGVADRLRGGARRFPEEEVLRRENDVLRSGANECVEAVRSAGTDTAAALALRKIAPFLVEARVVGADGMAGRASVERAIPLEDASAAREELADSNVKRGGRPMVLVVGDARDREMFNAGRG